MNANEWREECNYIDTVSITRKLGNFNNDIACFIRYCEMQRDTAEKQGFFDAALFIQECIDDLTED